MRLNEPEELDSLCLVLDLAQLPYEGLQRAPQVGGNSLVPLFIYLLSHSPSPATFPTPPNPVPGAKGQWGENSLRNAATKKKGKKLQRFIGAGNFQCKPPGRGWRLGNQALVRDLVCPKLRCWKVQLFSPGDRNPGGFLSSSLSANSC